MNEKQRWFSILWGIIMMPILSVTIGVIAYKSIGDNNFKATILGAGAILGSALTVIHYRAFILYLRAYFKKNGIVELWSDIYSAGIVLVVVGIMTGALFLFMRLIAKAGDPYIADINRCLIGSTIGCAIGVLLMLVTRKKAL